MLGNRLQNSRITNYLDDVRKGYELWHDNAERRDDNPHVADDIEKLLIRHIPQPGEVDQRTGPWHYLWRLIHPERFVEPLEQVHAILAHPGSAYFVVYSRDGKRFATAGADGTAKIFEAETGKLLTTLSGHVGGVNWVELAPDGRPLAATAGEDGTIRLWDTDTGKQVWLFGDSSAEVVGAAFSPTEPRLATVDARGKLTVWDIDSKKPVHFVKAHDGRITSVAWSPDGTRIVTTSEVARIWDAATLTLFGTHTSPGPESAVFSPDGETLATTGGMRAIYLDNLRLGNRRAGWEGFKNKFQSVRFSVDGRSLIAVGDGDDSILFCDLATRHCWNASPGPHGSLWCVAPSPDGVHIATTGRDGRVIVYKQSVGPQWTVQTTPADRPMQFSIAPDASMAAGLFSDHPNDRDVRDMGAPPPREHKIPTVLRVWDLTQSAPRVRYDFSDDRIGSFALSKDLKTIAVGENDQIVLLDAAAGKVRSRLPFPGLGRFRRLAWLSDEKSLCAISEIEHRDGPPIASLHILSLDGKQPQLVAEGRLNSLGMSAFSRDGKLIAVLQDDRIDIYDTATRSIIAQTPYRAGVVNSLEFAPDGSQLAIGTSDGEIHFWDVTSKRDVLVWSTHTGHSINGIRYVGQGRVVAAHSIRGRFIRIWSLERQETINSLPLPVTMSAGMKFPFEVPHPLWQREPFKFDTSAGGEMMAMIEIASEKVRERRTIYFWDRRPETPSQSTPRVRPAFIRSDGRVTWLP